MDIFMRFEPENIDPYMLSLFYLKVIDTIILPSMGNDDMTPGSFIPASWMRSKGMEKMLYLHPDAKEPNADLLPDITSYPSLLDLIHEMKLYKHGILLFSPYEQEPHNFEELPIFKSLNTVNVDRIYWIEQDTEYMLVRTYHHSHNKIKASLISDNFITYYRSAIPLTLPKEIENAWDESDHLDIDSLREFKVIERLIGSIRPN
ncbi:hypothetical protein [Litoribacter populi]|uniref:hypothetical protein n=1 Tax=Litoribacter populi TaxID=2598460 RepID=UPI00117E277D|nr:hypothetical protein [Litoribacter populi]